MSPATSRHQRCATRARKLCVARQLPARVRSRTPICTASGVTSEGTSNASQQQPASGGTGGAGGLPSALDLPYETSQVLDIPSPCLCCCSLYMLSASCTGQLLVGLLCYECCMPGTPKCTHAYSSCTRPSVATSPPHRRMHTLPPRTVPPHTQQPAVSSRSGPGRTWRGCGTTTCQGASKLPRPATICRLPQWQCATWWSRRSLHTCAPP